MMKPWEAKHPYYCAEGNFYRAGMIDENQTLDDFIAKWSQYDMDMNLLFRWDWITNDEHPDDETMDELLFFWVMQRKGYSMSSVVKNVKRDDEHVQKLMEFLQPRYELLMTMWQPLETKPTQ
jgi:hypothetical protein